MLKMAEITKMDKKAITAKIAELRDQTFAMRLQKVTTGLEKPHTLRTIKKDIARLKTALNKSGN